ncbi:MAG: hypothetical protein RIA71_10160 [Oceanicaulis sp.]
MIDSLSILLAGALCAAASASAGGDEQAQWIEGDFNGDGLAGDRVELVLDGDRRRLLLRFTGEDQPRELADFDPVHDFVLEAVPPGRFENACVRGVFSGCAGRLQRIETATESFVLRRLESSATLHVWLVDDGGRFLRFALSG